MLYWTAAGNTTLGGSGPWDASHYYWWDPTTLSAVQWQSGDIAVFEETCTGWPLETVTIAAPFVADPSAVLFLAVIIRSLAAARSPCRQSPRSPSRPGSPRRSAPRWTVASFWRSSRAGSSCSLEPITTRHGHRRRHVVDRADRALEVRPGHQLPTSRSPATALCSGPEPLIYTPPLDPDRRGRHCHDRYAVVQ